MTERLQKILSARGVASRRKAEEMIEQGLITFSRLVVSWASSAAMGVPGFIIGVVLIVPLTPILEAPVLAPAFAQMLPALFGGLAVVFISKNAKLSIAPIALMLILFIFVPALNASTVGIMVPVGVVFTVIVARILYKKGVL